MRIVIDLESRSATQHPDEPTSETDEQRAARLAAIAERDDQIATVSHPFITNIVSMTRSDIIAYIDNQFSAMTAAQRQALKALALAARFAIKKGQK